MYDSTERESWRVLPSAVTDAGGVVVLVVVISRRGSTLARGMLRQPCRMYDSTERESWRVLSSAVTDGGCGGSPEFKPRTPYT